METAASFEVRNAPSSYPTVSDLGIAGHRPTILIYTIQFPRAWGCGRLYALQLKHAAMSIGRRVWSD